MEGLGVLEEMGELTRRGEAFALATVVWRQGPSSSQSGSRAIITAEGELHGWIGGACAEPVVIREAQRVMAEGTAKLLLLGTPEQFGAAVPDGMTVVPISCQSEGAIEVYIEPVLPVPHLVVVGDSPMACTLASLAGALGWRTDLVRGPDFTPGTADERSMIVVATQGHDDEDVLERAIPVRPAYLGLVGSRRRGATVLGYLADRGLPQDQLDRVRVPAPGPGQHDAPGDRGRHPGRTSPAAGLRRAGGRKGQHVRNRIRAAGRDRACPGPGLRDDGLPGGPPGAVRGHRLLLLLRRLPPGVRERPRCLREKRDPMLIKNEFEVAEPVEKVWQFFENIPQVAACLPGAELTEDLGDDKYKGKVAVRMGPVRLQFAGTADITERDEAAKRVVVHASGADEKGRGQASMVVTATLARAGRGTKVGVAQDLQLSGAAAQYGRGMIADVTAVLMRDFSANMQDRIERIERGESAEQIAAAAATPAKGFTLGLRAALMALTRVFRRFFMPYQAAS